MIGGRQFSLCDRELGIAETEDSIEPQLEQQIAEQIEEQPQQHREHSEAT